MKIPPSLTVNRSLRLAAAAMMLSALAARAEDPSLQDLLRDGLYAEEVSRDPEAAARQYQQVLTRHAEQNAIAATALFRLAEVRRKQDRKDDAIKLYQQLLTEFPQIDPQAKLARENLTAMGGKPPEPGAGGDDPETKEIARLSKLAQTSPDLARDPAELLAAANKNRPGVVKFLLDSGVKTEGSDALVTAARLGHLEVVKLLLTKSKEQLTNEGGKALSLAAASGYAEVVRALLAAKVDPNWQPGICNAPPGTEGRNSAGSREIGTPLMVAIQYGKKEMIDILLDAKADVKLPANGTGYTALHVAAGSSADGAPDLVKRLFDLGADVNALTASQDVQGSGARQTPISVPLSPLQFAVDCNAWECAKTLIRCGANLQQPGLFDPFIKDKNNSGRYSAEVDVPKIQFLIDNGADPNGFGVTEKWDRSPGLGDPFAVTSNQVEEVSIPVLWLAYCQRGTPLELVRVLLATGAKPGPILGSIMKRVAKQDEDGSLVKALLAQRPETVNLAELPNMSEWKPAARRVFLDEVVIPALAKEPGTQMLFTNSGQWLNLTKSAAGEPVPATPALLLNHASNLLLSRRDTSQFRGSDARWPNLTLVRLKAGGEWSREEVDLTGTQPLPALTQGDILEVTPQQKTTGRSDEYEQLYDKLSWHLRKRIAFPVTVEIAGQTRAIQVRGDRLVFDPTQAEAPLVGAGKLMELLWVTERFHGDCRPNVVVVRKDWPELKRPLSELLAKDFDLAAGDRVKLDLPQEIRKTDLDITLKAAGDLPFACYFQIDNSKEHSPQLPTLIQALTHAMAPSSTAEPTRSRTSPQPPGQPGQPPKVVAAPPSDPKDLPVLMVAELGSNPQRILPHPDLSRLRIRRGGADGNVIEVNLEKAIAVPADQMSTEQARQADVQLQPGDIVEVPIRQDQLKTPWLGFTQPEEAFFAKALNCKVSVTDYEGNTVMKAMAYHQPRYVETAAGIIALPPTTGTATMAVSAASGFANPARGCVARGAEQWPLTEGKHAFVREADGILANYSVPRQPRPIVRPPGTSRQPSAQPAQPQPEPEPEPAPPEP
ncbi:MAG: ankyrin repeat domain-containing protein [Verrucomicrobia bacterium]|nr:ankyrin repeat domain-containing protein [Verrucomicrobiota bacterium]